MTGFLLQNSAAKMRYPPTNTELFLTNRERLKKRLLPNSLAVVNTNDIPPTNADGSLAMPPNSDLFYLTGVEQEQTILVLYPDADDEKHREILFLREPTSEVELWEGHKLTRDEARKLTGIRNIQWLPEFPRLFHRLMCECEHVYLNSNEHKRAVIEVETREARFVADTIRRYPLHDYQRLARLMARVMHEEHLSVDTANDGDTGLELALRGSYDVAIIDWMLPGRDGPAISRTIRAARLPTAILLLTSRSQVEDRVIGLDSGADDYLVKPFAFEELLARVRALGRRFSVVSGDPWELRRSDLVLDMRARTARRGIHALDLTTTEWNLLECLMRHAGQALSRQQILDYVWSYERDVQASMVDVYISYLRRKLSLPGHTDPIQTVRGVGYRLEGGDV